MDWFLYLAESRYILFISFRKKKNMYPSVFNRYAHPHPRKTPPTARIDPSLMEEMNRDSEPSEEKSAGERGATPSTPSGGLILPRDPNILLFIGKPKSGKSHAIKSIMYNYAKMKHFKFGYVFVSTKYNHEYDYLPDKWVGDKYSDKNLEKYIKYLENMMSQVGSMPPNFLILDDLLGRINFYSPEVVHFLSTFRHTKTTVFLTSQYLGARGSSTALREYANYVFIWRSTSGASVNLLYSSFGQFSNANQRKQFENINDFVKLLLEATDLDKEEAKYRCLLLINTVGSLPSFHFWKAIPAPEGFKIVP